MLVTSGSIDPGVALIHAGMSISPGVLSLGRTSTTTLFYGVETTSYRDLKTEAQYAGQVSSGISPPFTHIQDKSASNH